MVGKHSVTRSRSGFLIKSRFIYVFKALLWLYPSIRCSTSLWESTYLCLRWGLSGWCQLPSWGVRSRLWWSTQLRMMRRGWQKSERCFCLCLSYRWWLNGRRSPISSAGLVCSKPLKQFAAHCAKHSAEITPKKWSVMCRLPWCKLGWQI